MKTMRITDHEVKMIMAHRNEIHHEKATLRFRKEVLELAYQFNEHLEKEGEGPSFSGFINFFNLPYGGDNQLKYDAVLLILKTVNSLQIPKPTKID